MANASSSRVSIRFVKEATYGITPPSPAMTTLRRVPGGGGLARNSTVVSSQEADASRTIPDQVETGYGANFDYNMELQATAHNPFWIAILGGTTYTVNMTGTTIAANATGNVLTDSANGFVTAGVKPGMWLNLSGFTAGALGNNGYARVLDVDAAVAAGTIQIDPATKVLVTAAAGGSIALKTTMVRTGTANQDSFSFEQQYTDLTNVYLQGVGYRPTRAQLNVTAGQIVTGTINFIGQNTTPNTTAFAGETVTPAGTTQSMNATSNIAQLYEGGAVISTLTRQATININPNVTELRAISYAAAAGLIDGTFDITVTLNMMFSDLTMINKVINRTPTSLWLPFRDGAGKGVIFSFPKGYLGGTPKEQGQNQPVAQDLTFTAVRYTGWTLTPSVMAQIDMMD